jgi:hypothetical protein
VGRHAQPDGGSFYRSLGMSALRALLVLLVVALGTAAMVVLTADLSPSSPAMTQPDADMAIEGQPEDVASQTARAAGSPTVAPAETSAPSPTSASSPSVASPPTPGRATEIDDAGEAATEPDAGDAPRADVKPPARTTVQVLDGGAGPGATQEVVTLLRDLGYDIVAVSGARCCYDETTVLYTSGNLPLGRAMADRDERFAAVRPSPNLSESVDVHVVVGRDWVR